MTDRVDVETGEIIRYSEFEQQLAEATTPAETRKVILEMDVLLKLAKAVGESTERVNELQIARINAIRQAGRMLAELEREQGKRNDLTSGGDNRKLSPYRQAYEEAQISDRLSRFWQQVHVIPQDVWEAYQDDCLMSGSEISLTGFLIFARKPHVANNSGENEWYTPAELIEAARATMGSIDLDPASSEIANQIVQTDTFYTIDDDGLSQHWFGNVWLNPPYAQPEISDFADKVVLEAENVRQICILVNNATDTAWFHKLLDIADAVCLLRGRVKFLDVALKPKGAPLQGQIVLYAGANVDAFEREFSGFGKVLYVHWRCEALGSDGVSA